MIILLYLSIYVSVLLASMEEQNQKLKETNLALRLALENLELTSGNEVSVGDRLQCPSRDVWNHGWKKSSDEGCQEWWTNNSWGAGRSCSKCRNDPEMAQNCPRTCCENCRSSCECASGSTCEYSSSYEQHQCYLDGGMMGAYCKDSKRSASSNSRRYFSWRPCKEQLCERTTDHGDFTCSNAGWIYFTGGPAGQYCPGALKSRNGNYYWSEEVCKKSNCECTDKYGSHINCAERNWCYLDGDEKARECPGALKSRNGNFYWSYDPCIGRSKTKVIGYWHGPTPVTRSMLEDREITVTVETESTRTYGTSDDEVEGWAKQISYSHDVEVAVEAGASWGVGEASLAAKYNYHHGKSHDTHFERKLTQYAEDTFTQKKTVEIKRTIEKQKLDDAMGHVNYWVFRVEAINKLESGRYWSTSRQGAYAIETYGCGHDVAPNCLPGHCDSEDPHCWTCTARWAMIDPDFKRPCHDRCVWKAVKNCPDKRTVASLPDCTQDMKHNELCQSELRKLPNGESGNINNCYGRYDVFRYECD